MSIHRPPRYRHAFGILVSRVRWHPITSGEQCLPGAISARPISCLVIDNSTCILNPRFLSSMASYDVASNTCRALAAGEVATEDVRRSKRAVGPGVRRRDTKYAANAVRLSIASSGGPAAA